MNEFNHYQPTKIHFGSGKLAEIGQISKKYGKRCLLVTPIQNDIIKPMYNRAIAYLTQAQIEVFVFDQVEANPTTSCVDRAVTVGNEKQVDFIVGMGGGSTIDTAKVVSYCCRCGKVDWNDLFNPLDSIRMNLTCKQDNIPCIAIPTTSGTGAQCTQAAVITNMRTLRKMTIFRESFFPNESLIDPDLMSTLPFSLTMSTAFDAFSHLSESYLNGHLSPICKPLAIEGMKLIIHSLPKCKETVKNEERIMLATADTLAGICLSNGGANIPHFIGEAFSSFIPSISHGNSLILVYPHFIKEYYKDCKYQSGFNDILKLFQSTLPNEEPEMIVKEFIEKCGIHLGFSDFKAKSEQVELIRNWSVTQTRYPNDERIAKIVEAVLSS